MIKHPCSEVFDLVGLFPGEIRVVPSEMTVSRGFAIDRPQQIERFDDTARGQVEVLADQFHQSRFADLAGPVGENHDRHRFGHADGIGQLHRAFVRQSGGDDILGDVAGHVGRRAVDLGRIFAGERAAAVGGHAAIGIDDDLAAGHAGIGLRPADHKFAGRIDVIFGLVIEHRFGNYRVERHFR